MTATASSLNANRTSVRLALLVAALSVGVGGCTISDHLAKRAGFYNSEIGSEGSSQILLNIIRSAYAEQAQITEVSSIDGTASASISPSIGLPVRVGGTPFTTAQTLSLSAAPALGGGSKFTVTNLNSQEFEQGLDAPIEVQTLGAFSEQYTLKLVLRLFLASIEVDQPGQHRRIIIANSAATVERFNTFTTVVDTLARGGLSVESVASNSPIGPELSRNEAVRQVGQVTRAIATDGAPRLNFKEVSEKAGRYQVSKPGSQWRFCFVPRQVQEIDLGPSIEVLPLNPVGSQFLPVAYFNGTPIGVRVEGKYFCGNSSDKRDSNTLGNITFRLRSVRDIIAFLGEMVRTQLGLSDGNEEELFDPNGGPLGQFAVSDPAEGPRYIFRVASQKVPHAELSTTFNGRWFSVMLDPSGNDASTRVMDILSRLINLNRSSKDRPSPSFTSIVSP